MVLVRKRHSPLWIPSCALSIRLYCKSFHRQTIITSCLPQLGNSPHLPLTPHNLIPNIVFMGKEKVLCQNSRDNLKSSYLRRKDSDLIHIKGKIVNVSQVPDKQF